MTHLSLIRHGSYIGEVGGKLVEHGLSPLGVKQAELLRDRLTATGEIKADVLITSTRPPARHTAEVIAPALNQPVVRDPDFEEWRNEDGSQRSMTMLSHLASGDGLPPSLLLLVWPLYRLSVGVYGPPFASQVAREPQGWFVGTRGNQQAGD